MKSLVIFKAINLHIIKKEDYKSETLRVKNHVCVNILYTYNVIYISLCETYQFKCIEYICI